MCGIAGLVSFDTKVVLSEDQLKALAAPMKYRGPDAEGFYSQIMEGVNLQLAHKRLSIIDLSEGGNQPMGSASGKSVIVFNGEIYNYKSLKQELSSQGAVFRTHSDTEVLLNGFEIWGIEKLLDKIEGMFAFGLYSYKDQSLYLARDRFGKKPLYYYYNHDLLVFSSDIRSFNAVDAIPKVINKNFIGYFFTELTAPEPQSVWQDIHKVPAAHFIQFNKGKQSSLKRYWTLEYITSCKLSKAEILDKTDELFTEAVAKRMVADVNVAAQLSGGIDSSLVAAKMASLSGNQISTYSVGFKEEKYNELPYARMVAEQYKTNQHEMIMQPSDIKVTNKLIYEYGEPFADVSMIPSYMISKYISKNEKVVCGGDGGDELFAGYYIYYFVNKFDKVKHLKWAAPLVDMVAKIRPTYRLRFLRRLLRAAKEPTFMLLHRRMGFLPDEMDALFFGNTEITDFLDQYHKEIWEQYAQVNEPTIKKVLRAALDTRLVNDYLVKVDRASMFASLEMRSPFLDRKLAEFAFTLSNEQLFQPHGTKSILKQLAERYLPKELIYRNKMGFGVPIGEWFRGELKTNFEEVVLGGKQRLIPIEYKFVEKLFKDHCEHKSKTENAHKLWSLYVFHLWAQSVNS